MGSDQFTTGAQRGAQEGKGRYDLLSTIATRELALLLEKGAAEYGERNWEKGIPIMRHLSSAKRHIDQFIERQVTEVNSKGETVFVKHAVNAFANLMMAIHTLAKIEEGSLPRELDDRPTESPRGQTPLEVSLNGRERTVIDTPCSLVDPLTGKCVVKQIDVPRASERPKKPYLYTVIRHYRDNQEWDIKRLKDGFVMDCNGCFDEDFDDTIGWYDTLDMALDMYDSIGLSRADLLNRYGDEV